MRSSLIVLTCVLASQLQASAQIVPINPTAPDVTNTVNADAYYLFANSISGSYPYSNLNNLSALGLTETQLNLTFPESYAAPLTISGTTFGGSGVVYNIAGTATGAPGTGAAIPGTGTPVDFITFQFGAGAVKTLQVGVDSNFPDTSFYTLVLENSSGATIFTSAVLNPLQTNNDNGGSASPRSNNDFYYADVEGISPGDFLVVEGNAGIVGRDSQVTLGAVTFNYVPEPSTYALLGLGALALVFVSRRLKLSQDI